MKKYCWKPCLGMGLLCQSKYLFSACLEQGDEEGSRHEKRIWSKIVPSQFRGTEWWEDFLWLNYKAWERKFYCSDIHLEFLKSGREHKWRGNGLNFGIKIDAGLKESQKILRGGCIALEVGVRWSCLDRPRLSLTSLQFK